MKNDHKPYDLTPKPKKSKMLQYRRLGKRDRATMTAENSDEENLENKKLKLSELFP